MSGKRCAVTEAEHATVEGGYDFNRRTRPVTRWRLTLECGAVTYRRILISPPAVRRAGGPTYQPAPTSIECPRCGT